MSQNRRLFTFMKKSLSRREYRLFRGRPQKRGKKGIFLIRYLTSKNQKFRMK